MRKNNIIPKLSNSISNNQAMNNIDNMIEGLLPDLDVNSWVISFNTNTRQLLDSSLHNIIIFKFHKQNTVFILERDENMNLRFIQSNPNYDTKISSIDIASFRGKEWFKITCVYSKEWNILYAGQSNDDILKWHYTVNNEIKYRIDNLWNIIDIIWEGIEIESLSIVANGQILLEPKAKEVFDFQLSNITTIANSCKLIDFSFETILCQQGIVMLCTLFETYLKTRFLELEHEWNTPNFDGLCNCFISSEYRETMKVNIMKQVWLKTALEILILDKNQVNFQNRIKAKDAYLKTYNISFNSLIKSQEIVEIKKYLNRRHKITHSKDDCTILNAHSITQEEPVFCNQEVLLKGLNLFNEFISKLHKKTMQII